MDKLDQVRMEYGGLKLDLKRGQHLASIRRRGQTLLQRMHDEIEGMEYDFQEVEPMTNGLLEVLNSVKSRLDDIDDFFSDLQ